MAEKPESTPGSSGRKPQGIGGGASTVTARRVSDYRDNCKELMEAVVERGNMTAAYKRVVSNKGSSGIDGRTVDELKPYLATHWARIKSELLEDRYKPQAVREVAIPKPSGGIRKLGIPTVVDRLIGAGIASDSGTDIRPVLFGLELRIPEKSERAPSGEAGTEVCSGRLSMGS